MYSHSATAQTPPCDITRRDLKEENRSNSNQSSTNTERRVRALDRTHSITPSLSFKDISYQQILHPSNQLFTDFITCTERGKQNYLLIRVNLVSSILVPGDDDDDDDDGDDDDVLLWWS